MAVKFKDEIEKRKRYRRVDGQLVPAGESQDWYGRWKPSQHSSWQWEKLYRDKPLSRRKWQEFQKEMEARDCGAISDDTERLKLPLPNLVDFYTEKMRVAGNDPEHIRIARWMLQDMIKRGSWSRFSDVTTSNVEAVLRMLEEDGATVSYRNKYVSRIKAFVNRLLPEGHANPLKKLRRISEKGAKRRRARRAGSEQELRRLFSQNLPEQRRLAYALAALNSFRRNEMKNLETDQLHLDTAIPFVFIPYKQADTDEGDYIPLHPYVIPLLRQRLATMSGNRVFDHVPDVETLERDLKKVGVEMTDAKGRRLDLHGLRHTFGTRLECSRATRKKLMRHAKEDVTDGYQHAELEEMLAALKRLRSPLDWGQNPSPIPASETTVATPARSTLAVHGAIPNQHVPSRDGTIDLTLPQCEIALKKQAFGTTRHDSASSYLIGHTTSDIVAKTRPSTQVD
ncbi:MAG TPA: site-specific integrase [Tepidisphaeraceae bacterium]